MDRNMLSASYLSLVHNRPEGGYKTAAQYRGRNIGNLVRELYQIHVGIVQRDIFSKGAPMCKAGLKLMIADLMVARNALSTVATATDKGNGDPVTDFEIADFGAFGDDDSGQFMAGDVG